MTRQLVLDPTWPHLQPLKLCLFASADLILCHQITWFDFDTLKHSQFIFIRFITIAIAEPWTTLVGVALSVGEVGKVTDWAWGARPAPAPASPTPASGASPTPQPAASRPDQPTPESSTRACTRTQSSILWFDRVQLNQGPGHVGKSHLARCHPSEGDTWVLCCRVRSSPLLCNVQPIPQIGAIPSWAKRCQGVYILNGPASCPLSTAPVKKTWVMVDIFFPQ